VYDLLTARPHVRDGRRLSPDEFRVYVEGYDAALQRAFQVMDLAVDRWKARKRHKHESTHKRSA